MLQIRDTLPCKMPRTPQDIWTACGSLRPAPWSSCTIRTTSRTSQLAASWSTTPGTSTCSSICSSSSPASSLPVNISIRSATPLDRTLHLAALWRGSIRCIWRRWLSMSSIALALHFGVAKDRQSRALSVFRSARATAAAACLRWRTADIQLPELVAVGGNVLLRAFSGRSSLIAARRKALIVALVVLPALANTSTLSSPEPAVGRLDQPGRRLQGAARLQPRRRLLPVSRPDRALARRSRAC